MRLTELYARLAAGQISEADAERLDHRHRPPAPRKRGGGTRPRKPEHIERRRGWAGTARLPLHVARCFALAGQAVLAVVAREIRQTGDCRKSHREIADLAGCSESSVRNTLREARALRFIAVEERRISRNRNLPNVVRIIDPVWLRQAGVKPVRGVPSISIKKETLLCTRQDMRYKKRAAEVFAPPQTALTATMHEIEDGYGYRGSYLPPLQGKL